MHRSVVSAASGTGGMCPGRHWAVLRAMPGRSIAGGLQRTGRARSGRLVRRRPATCRPAARPTRALGGGRALRGTPLSSGDRIAAVVRACARMQRIASLTVIEELVAAHPDGCGVGSCLSSKYGRLAAAGVGGTGVPPWPVIDALLATADEVLPDTLRPGPLPAALARRPSACCGGSSSQGLGWWSPPDRGPVRRSEPAGSARAWTLTPSAGRRTRSRIAVGCESRASPPAHPLDRTPRNRTVRCPDIRVREHYDRAMITTIVMVSGRAATGSRTSLRRSPISTVSARCTRWPAMSITIAIVRVRDFEQIADVSRRSAVQGPGVRHTTTQVAFRAYSRHDLDAAFSIGAD